MATLPYDRELLAPTKLSRNFSLAEATRSETAERWGIKNFPDADTLNRMTETAIRMEFIRALLNLSLIHI